LQIPFSFHPPAAKNFAQFASSSYSAVNDRGYNSKISASKSLLTIPTKPLDSGMISKPFVFPAPPEKQKTRISARESGSKAEDAHFPFQRSFCEPPETRYPGFP